MPLNLDYANSLLVSVTQQDIDNGERANGSRCPIRQALSRVGYHHVVVPWTGQEGSGLIKLTDPHTGTRYDWSIPIPAFKWLEKFDRGDYVEPFSFRLDMEKAAKRLRRKRVASKAATYIRKEVSTPRFKRIPKGMKRPIEDI